MIDRAALPGSVRWPSHGSDASERLQARRTTALTPHAFLERIFRPRFDQPEMERRKQTSHAFLAQIFSTKILRIIGDNGIVLP
jgi:hypothetical protein